MSYVDSFNNKTNNSQLQCMYRLLDAQAKRSPDAIAITAPERQPLSYGRLQMHIEEVVNTLNSMGVGRNDRVAIVLPDGPEMAVVFLAVAAGATSAPLNPNYRASEFDFYLSDLKVRTLIVQSGLESPARAVAETLGISIIELTPVLQAEAGIFTLKGGSPLQAVTTGFAQFDDMALVLHTSGTTSRPKIVPLTQTNICTSAQNIKNTLKLANSDRCLNIMPLFHIHGLIGVLLSSLSAGASVVCSPGFDALGFYAWLNAFSPTWYSAVPTMHQAILERSSMNKEVIQHTPLRFIRSSSASLPPIVMTALEETFNAPVVESYGMTEASHQMASNPLPPLVRKPGSVGMAAGPEVAIMGDAGNLLPTGEIGEIVIRGANVTPGYENNPEDNQNAFTNGWFRTGDQGLLDAEEYLFIQGRLKEIINRGGEKVSPREVDEAIMEHPAVAQVVTFAVPHETLGEDMAAVVILKENTSVKEQELREFAFEKLADFKVPSQIVFVDEIPKGPTGKLQRIGLAEKLASKLHAEYMPPQEPGEKTLARLWSKVLGIERIGLYDNFFNLGGDSLLAVRLFAQIQKIFGKDLPLTTLFHAPTVEQLAGVLRQEGWSSPWSSLVPMQHSGSRPPLFCTHGCGGIVFHMQGLARHLFPEQPFYGLKAQGLEKGQAPHTRIEDMAAFYIKEIQTIQPDGPYFIGSTGVGGAVGLEMAQQLKSQGQNVGLLVLINPRTLQPNLSHFSFIRSIYGGSLKYFFHRLVDFMHNRPLLPYIKYTFFNRVLVNWRIFQKFVPMNIHREYHFRGAIRDALLNYTPQVYPGRVTCFLCEKFPGNSQKRIGDWYDIAGGGLDVGFVPGTIEGMWREPHVQILAEKLKACLDEAQTNG